jgi:hypothetical protein
MVDSVMHVMIFLSGLAVGGMVVWAIMSEGK